jgi:hypothetical protein
MILSRLASERAASAALIVQYYGGHGLSHPTLVLTLYATIVARSLLRPGVPPHPCDRQRCLHHARPGSSGSTIKPSLQGIVRPAQFDPVSVSVDDSCLARRGIPVDEGRPISYEALAVDTPVVSSSGTEFGRVHHVLQVPELDLCDGISVKT